MLLSLILMMTGCSGAAAAVETTEKEQVGRETAVPLPTSTLPSPLVSMVVPSPTANMPSFAPANPTAISALSAANARVMAEATLQSTVAMSLTITATPQPTFTPPALPFTSNEEHFWLRRPIPEGGVVWTDKTYPYGSTRGGTLRPHHGVEFYVPSGTEIIAAASGTVVVAGNDLETIYGPHANFYGNLVIVELDSRSNGLPVFTLYAHLSQVLVNQGQRVAAQELIGLSGATGIADGPHMHFEVRLGQNSYTTTRNPLLWLYPFPDHGAIAGRVLWPNGAFVEQAPITLRRIDAPSKYHATTSYAGDSVNGDDLWQENFAFDDVIAGYYEIEIQANGKKYKQELWVFPYRTSQVELTINE